MKKLFFTLALILSVMSLSAQKFTITEKESGNVVENGATYYVYGSGYYGEGSELLIEFDFTSNTAISVIGRKTPTNIIEGTYTYICFGSCLAPTTGVQETTPNMLEADSTMTLSGHYMADDYMAVLGQEQYLTLEVWDEETPEETFIINVIFKYSLDGVEDNNAVTEFSNAYPMPAIDVVNFDYNFASSENAEVAIYNMMGQEVLRNSISSMSGKLSINVSDLSDGVYFYSLIVNGVVEKSNKLIIRK
ncbi:MAG: T9SS type A sorting domain-containing protein [Bacteroidales bacterium]|nr:T9SS type A sorting domain-containing protein [Bacteroidales bacterium]